MLKQLLTLTAACLLISDSVRADEPAAQQPAETQAAREHFFETTVRPLLHTRCVKCHGENKQESGLRLDSLEAMLAGGDSGAAIEPGHPDASLLLEAVRYESFEMPPDKPLSSEQIASLEHWIADGAAWPTVDGQSVRLQGAAFTEDERNFWSLQPISRPEVPQAGQGWARTAVDAFIAAKLQEQNLSPAPQATVQQLLRRLYFGVLGLPPAPAEAQELNSQHFDQQWPQLVDRLLADPRYGEHWARHWLDVVRYAESDGFRADFYRPDAWRYRDYVVSAFNDDLPYDQFLKEQLAGDEIAPRRADALVATGYLRTYLYEYNQRDARTQWQDILNQTTDVTGEAFLGLGFGCARCHDHKFDPILQADYFRLQAAFGSLIPRDDIPAADQDQRRQYEAEYQQWLEKGQSVRDQLNQLKAPYLARARRSAVEKFPADIQQIMDKDPAQRLPLEAQLADLVQRQIDYEVQRIKYKDDDEKQLKELEARLTELAGEPPPQLPSALTVTDVGPMAATIHLGADPRRRPVTAGGLTILDSEPLAVTPLPDSSGQRTALANWIASPQNPLTARVIVNRIWQQHFGTGLVRTASDFGSLGDRPSHPELLDWLAAGLIDNGWSLKWVHRQILNSATWQMSVFHPAAAAAEQIDPENRLRWRSEVRRLQAEQIRDAMLTVSGELQSEQGGPSVDHDSLRRSLYLKAIRNRPEALLQSLDGVDGLNSTPRRSVTTTPTQALQLMNGEWVRQRAAAMAERILDVTNSQNPPVVTAEAFQLAYGRAAAEHELAQAAALLAMPETEPESADSSTSADQTLQAALTDLCHVLLNSNEFVYID